MKLLEELYSQRNPEFIKSDYWDRKNEIRRDYFGSNNDRGPFSFQDIVTWKQHIPSKFEFVPKELYNKRVKINNDFSIIFQYIEDYPTDIDNRDDFKNGERREYYHFIRHLNIISCYKGLYLKIGDYHENYSLTVENYSNKNTKKSLFNNNFYNKFTEQKPYYVKEFTFKIGYNFYKNIEEIVNSLDLEKMNITESDIDNQHWYNSYQNEFGKSIEQYTTEQLDWKYFIEKEIKNGIFKPEKATIDNILTVYAPPKNLLKELGVHTVRLRSNCHFDVHTTFDLKGIKIIAPKSVLNGYHGMDKYCQDDKLLEQIKKEEEQKKRDQELEEYNDTFTLMQHGKVVLEAKRSSDIIYHLENLNITNVEDKIIKSVQPIFDNIPKVKKLYLATWGYHWEAELRGERKDLDEDVYDYNTLVMDKETIKEVYELFYNNMECVPDEKIIEIKYGWPELSYNILSVEKTRGKLNVVVENYREREDLK